jgi:hypothetical protein
LEFLRGSIVKHEEPEICSVSEHISSAPPGWDSRWDFNDASCYNSEAEALATVPQDQADAYDLFAYRILPVKFDTTGRQPIMLPEAMNSGIGGIAPEPDLSDYVSVGYDIAGGPLPTTDYPLVLGFSCSPLSCNAMSSEHAVNRFWLIDDFEQAIAVAEEFGRTEPEPGPYFVYQVLRKRSSRWSQ